MVRSVPSGAGRFLSAHAAVHVTDVHVSLDDVVVMFHDPSESLRACVARALVHVRALHSARPDHGWDRFVRSCAREKALPEASSKAKLRSGTGTGQKAWSTYGQRRSPSRLSPHSPRRSSFS